MSETKRFYRVTQDGYCTYCHSHDDGIHKEDCIFQDGVDSNDSMFTRKIKGFDIAKPGADKTAFMIGINGQNFEVNEEVAEQFGKHIRQLKVKSKKITELEMQNQMESDEHFLVIQKCKEAIQLIYSHRGEDALIEKVLSPLLQNTLNIY